MRPASVVLLFGPMAFNLEEMASNLIASLRVAMPGAPFVANLVPSSKARSPDRSVLVPSSKARSP